MPPVPQNPNRGHFLKTFSNLHAMANMEIFIELTNQIFWEGYAETLAKDNPAQLVQELTEFENLYHSDNHVRHHISIGQGDHTNHAQKCA